MLGQVLFKRQFASLAGSLRRAVACVLWGGRRIDAVTGSLVGEFNRIRTGGDMLTVPVNDGRSRRGFLGRRVKALQMAALRLRDLHRLVSHSLEGLPDAVLVCDRTGVVLLANAAAARHFGVASGKRLHDANVLDLMCDLVSESDHQFVITATALREHSNEVAVAARDGRDRDLLVKGVPSFSGEGAHTGWIFSLVSLTVLRQAQRQRDDAMYFLGHDFRAPQASILTVLELHRQDPAAMSVDVLHERIERHARKALALSDDFLHLVRAQSQNYLMERRNLGDVLQECIDDAWEMAKQRRIRIVMAPSRQKAESLIDREMVARAIGNLLRNALKFSPEETAITCAIESIDAGWAVLVKDQGPGIATDIQVQIFQPFVRGRGGNHADGVGLGLALVKVVAQCHGGKVLLNSAPGRGSAFRLVLPRA